MKKKILMIIFVAILAIMLLILTGCRNNKEKVESNLAQYQEENKNEILQTDIKDIYLEVINNKRKYVNEKDNERKLVNKQDGETDINEYINKLNEQFGINSVELKINYTILDIDNDNEIEMVADFDNGGFYLILNYEDGIVYGFEEVARGLKGLRIDGSYISSGGAGFNVLCKTSFNADNREITVLAEMENSIYKIENKIVTEPEYNNYMQEQFYSKNEAEWVEFTLPEELLAIVNKELEIPSNLENKLKATILSSDVTYSLLEGLDYNLVVAVTGKGEVYFADDLENCSSFEKLMDGYDITDIDSMWLDKGFFAVTRSEKYSIFYYEGFSNGTEQFKRVNFQLDSNNKVIYSGTEDIKGFNNLKF